MQKYLFTYIENIDKEKNGKQLSWFRKALVCLAIYSLKFVYCKFSTKN